MMRAPPESTLFPYTPRFRSRARRARERVRGRVPRRRRPHRRVAVPPLAAVPDLDQELDELYGLPLEDWTRARNDLAARDRKSTRLNSSHANTSYGVFCLIQK